MVKRIWIGVCYVWAATVVIGVILLLLGDDSIRPTMTDFVVLLGIALAPVILGVILPPLFRHLASPADGSENDPQSRDEDPL